MGLFSSSKQITETTTNITSTDVTQTSNVQDSYNRITSITDAFKTSLGLQDSFNNPVSQVIALNSDVDAATGTKGESGFVSKMWRQVMIALVVGGIVWIILKGIRK